MTKRIRAIRDYAAQYPSPIRVRSGDRLELGRRDPEFPDWQWCRSDNGLEGWVPLVLIEQASTTQGRIKEDYSAQELALREGDQLEVLRRIGGWALVENQRKERGWVPETHLVDRSGD